MIKYLENPTPSASSVNDLISLDNMSEEVKDYLTELPSFGEIKEGLEDVEEYLRISTMSREEREFYIRLNDYSYGLEDIDSNVEAIKKAAVGVIKFILKLLDRIIKFVTSFFNKGMSLTEKFYIANIIRKRDNLERIIDEKNLNKNKPLDIKENVVNKIAKRKDLFVLEAVKNGGKITPTLVTNYVRNTLTLFTDNVTLFDNTCDSLINLVKDLKETTVTEESFVGYASEKNKDLEIILNPIKTAFSRNVILNKLIEVASEQNKKDNFDITIIPLPKKGIENNKMGYVAIGILKHEVLAKMKFDDIKSIDELIFGKEGFVDYQDLGINPDKIDKLQIKSASFTEIDNIVQIYKESSAKIKKKLNTDKITKKLDKIKKKMTVVNTNEFSSKVNNFKLFYVNTGIKIATTILQSSKDLYSLGYCDSIKDYIDAHTI